MVDKHKHRQRRKVISKTLSDDGLREFQPKLIHHLDTFLGKLCEDTDANGWSSPKDMSVLCQSPLNKIPPTPSH